MKIGVPKEIKAFENRVGLSPSSVSELVLYNHNVFVQTDAGLGSGFSNKDYLEAGANIVNSIEDVYNNSELIVKVKEPQEAEYNLLKQNHTLFTYLHLASSQSLTNALLNCGATCIAYETVQKSDGSLPLLLPMSEIAGRLSVIEGSKYLQKTYGGKGKLISSVPGVASTKVLVLGGGIVGTNAARMASGLGASVTIIDNNINRLRILEEILPANVKTIYSNRNNILKEICWADLIIGAVLIPGAQAPRLIRRADLQNMEPGTVLVDVAIDQGGCFETSKATTHMDPIYEVDGIIHYCVANMPGSVPRTATEALNNATLPYVLEIANKGINEALKNPEILKGLNIQNGKVVLKALIVQ
ncbi:MAG: alanine dehydrogenase [Opitutaceae bacterium]|nr:alanine dehydrogenase [Cytophagales bacterium]